MARIFLLGLLVVGAATLFMGVGPGKVQLLPCLFRSVTDLPCPGCGMTRACVAIARGELAQAWHFHPLSFILVAAALALALSPNGSRALATSLSDRQRMLLLFSFLGMVLCLWLLRLGTGWRG